MLNGINRINNNPPPFKEIKTTPNEFPPAKKKMNAAVGLLENRGDIICHEPPKIKEVPVNAIGNLYSLKSIPGHEISKDLNPKIIENFKKLFNKLAATPEPLK